MKRSVIQLAGKTSVVSLPTQWIKKFNIKKGDELDLEEKGNTIFIKPLKNESELKKITLDITNYSERTLRYAMSASHKLGYDEITLIYEKNNFNEVIQDLIRNLLLGFIVIEQTSKKSVLKNISNEIQEEFDPALRRAFLVSISLAKNSLELIYNRDFENLTSLISLEKTNNQLTSFCLRLINKGFYKNSDKQGFITTIIWNLEKITDEYKLICLSLSNNNFQIKKDILKLYKEVNDFFIGYYELFYNFSIESLNSLVKQKEELLLSFNTIKTINPKEIFLLNVLYVIVCKTSDLSSSIFALKYIEN